MNRHTNKQQAIILDHAYHPKAGDTYVLRYYKKRESLRVLSVSRRQVRTLYRWGAALEASKIESYSHWTFVLKTHSWNHSNPRGVSAQAFYPAKRS